MTSSRKKFINLLFIVGIFVVVLYIGLRGNNPKDIWQQLKSLPFYWLVLIISAWLCYMLTETLSMCVFFRMQGYKVPYFRMFRIVIIGNYYSSITPAATGGQPMQVYYLSKSGVPAGISSSILAVRFFLFQLALLSLGTFFWLNNLDFVYTQLSGHLWLLYMGYFFNALVVVAVLLLAINGRAVRFMVFGTVKLLAKVHLVKKSEHLKQRIEENLNNFEQSVRMLRNDPLQLLLQFVIMCVQFMFIFATTSILYIAFGLKGNIHSELYTMSALLFIAASYAPLPGASGAQEGGFALFFKNLFPGGDLFSALLLWRFSTYYTTLLLGFVLSLFSFKPLHTAIEKASFKEENEESEPGEENKETTL